MGLIECEERGLGEGKLGSRCSCPPLSSRRPNFRVPMGRLAWCSSPSSGRQESWGSPSLSPTLELCLVLSLLEEGAWLLPGGWTQLAPRLGQSGSDQPQALGLLVLAVPSLPHCFPEHSYHGGRWACGPCGPCGHLLSASGYLPAKWPALSYVLFACWSRTLHFADEETDTQTAGALPGTSWQKKPDSEPKSAWFQSWARFGPL